MIGDKRPQQRNVRRVQNLLDVDAAGIGGKKKRLPGEVFATTSWLCKEVSRSHSTWGNELPTERYRTHKQGRTERKMVLNFQWNGANYSLEKQEQVNKESETLKQVQSKQQND